MEANSNVLWLPLIGIEKHALHTLSQLILYPLTKVIVHHWLALIC